MVGGNVCHEWLIEVHASSVNSIAYRLRSGEMKGLLTVRFPRLPGYDVSPIATDGDENGTVQCGERVTAFLDSVRGGACADFAVCGGDVAAKFPDGMHTEHAAAIPSAGTTALQSLRNHGGIQFGQRERIKGASGGVGTFAIQIAKAHDFCVTAIVSGENRKFCLSLGANQF
jgi:NADPH:quinone reductase-like Zn-dependent oxidoreductase